jgi:hypothetical protein
MKLIDQKFDLNPLENRDPLLADLRGPMTELIHRVTDSVSSFRNSEDAGLGHLEETLKKPVGQFLAAILEKAAQQKADATPPYCPKCGSKLTQLRRVERTVQTAAGEIKLVRATGRCRKCKARFCPADEALGLEKGYSPAMQESAALLVSKMPVAEASAVLERLTGVRMPPTTLHRIAKDAGDKAKVQRKKSDEQARCAGGVSEGKAPKTLVIMLDAWNIRERDDWGLTKRLRKKGSEPQRWHWVWAGTVFNLDSRGDKRGRPIIVERGYVATREGTQSFSEQLHAEALRRGLGRADRVLVMGDGAAWIWTLAKDRFSEAVQRIDLYHVKEHLWVVARELHGENRQAASAWVKQMKKHLRRGHAAEMISTIEAALVGLPGEGKALVEKEVKYFKEHQTRMDYDQAEKLGEPRGSGAIESTCRQQQCRFKRPGQFWSKEGDEGLLCLETFWRNGSWGLLFPHTKGLDPSRN